VRRLRALGIPIAHGHGAETIGDVAVLVVSSAIGEDNVEVVAARERHIPVVRRAEMLAELGISQYRLARTIGVPPRRINEIVHGRRSVTADTALRIGRALGTTPEFWLNLQRMYELDRARTSADVSHIEPLVAAGRETTS